MSLLKTKRSELLKTVTSLNAVKERARPNRTVRSGGHKVVGLYSTVRVLIDVHLRLRRSAIVSLLL